MLGDPQDWPDELVAQHFLSPIGDDFSWFYEPGGVIFLDDTHLLCLDNGNTRAKKHEPALALEQRFSRIVCYRIDSETRTVSLEWEYGKEEGSALYSPYLGSCRKQEHGILSTFGGIGFLDGNVASRPAYFLKKEHPNITMQSTILLHQQQQMLFRLEVPFHTYDATCFSPAALNHTQTADCGTIVGHRYGNDVLDIALEFEDGGMLDARYRLNAYQTEEQIVLSACFYQGEMVILLLAQEDTTIPFYLQTSRNPYLSESFQTYANDSDRPICFALTTAPFHGTYEIMIGINDKKYHTDIFFTC